MMPIDRDFAHTRPLTTDALVEERVASLVGRAVSRQVWLLFVDEHDVQLPLVLPLSDVPVSPGEGDLDHWTEFLAGATRASGAHAVIVVIERYAPDRLGAADRSWARLARDACSAADVPLRAVALSHRRGVRLLGPDDYGG
jgi:hypothetical protein